jgi:DNA-binding NtrC family response regulator
MKTRILVIDDKENIRNMLRVSLEAHGYAVDVAENGRAGVDMFRDVIYDLVITDVRMPGMSGLEALDAIKEISPETAVIMITAFADMDDAINALKRGAADYIRKPFKLEELRNAVEKTLETRRLVEENRLLRREVESKYVFSEIIAKSRAMKNVFERIERIAEANSAALITGETGTGKELVARAIHYNSSRADRPFVTVNCAAIPQTLLESELFGHARGAFTDARQDKPGRFEEAADGTIFLDEISEMSPGAQAKLLRALQDGEYSRIGENRVRKAEARVVAATNIDLAAAVESGAFRKDLFFRVNVLPINLPPLRERREDIPLLIRHFLDVSCRHNSISLKSFSTAAMNTLINYSWPGNVRELQNVAERCCLMSAGGEIQADELPDELKGTVNTEIHSAAISAAEEEVSIKRALPRVTEAVEKELILKALKQSGGNRDAAAELLEISRRSLFYKLKQYGIED